MAGWASSTSWYLAWRSTSTRPCCCASRRSRRIAGVVAWMPSSNGLSRRRCAMCAARIMILEGTQPMLTQVPPRVPRSISVTLAPRSAAFSAAAMAAPPLPITATCGVGPGTHEPSGLQFVNGVMDGRGWDGSGSGPWIHRSRGVSKPSAGTRQHAPGAAVQSPGHRGDGQCVEGSFVGGDPALDRHAEMAGRGQERSHRGDGQG